MSELESQKEKLRELLDSQYSWPCAYLFKFIIKPEQKDELLALVRPYDQVKEKLSRNGKYVSLSIHKVVESAEDVFSVEKKVKTLKGLISL